MLRLSKLIPTGQTSPLSPSTVAFHNGLACAFLANDGTNMLYIMFSADGINWTRSNPIGNNTSPGQPALCVFNDMLYCAFTANDPSQKLYIVSSGDGQNWSVPLNPPGCLTGIGPALCVFTDNVTNTSHLYCAFQATDTTNDIYVVRSVDGQNWTGLGRAGGNSTLGVPSLCVFNTSLYCAFKVNDSSNRIYLMSSADGKTWTAPTNPGGITSAAGPSLAVFQQKLYCCFLANDPSQRIYTISSPDASTWGSLENPGGNTSSAGPVLASYKNQQLTCMFIAQDSSHTIYQLNQLEADWMQQNMQYIGTMTLGTACIPGSHDAGMSVSQRGTAFGNAGNTQTQTLNIHGQLRNGARYFDLRPTISGGNYYTGHYTNTGKPLIGWQGANGQSFDDIINDINEFTTTHKELIILYVSQDLQTDQGYRRFNQSEWNALIGKLQNIKGLYNNPNPNVDLTGITFNSYIGSSAAVVVVLVPGDSTINISSYLGKGFYAGSSFPVVNEYSNTTDPVTMISDQVSKMQANSNNYFLLSWTLTQGDGGAISSGIQPYVPDFIWWIVDQVDHEASVLELAQIANSKLYFNTQLMNAITFTCYPKIIFVDNVTPEVGLVEMAMNFNIMAGS